MAELLHVDLRLLAHKLQFLVSITYLQGAVCFVCTVCNIEEALTSCSTCPSSIGIKLNATKSTMLTSIMVILNLSRPALLLGNRLNQSLETHTHTHFDQTTITIHPLLLY